MDRIKAIIRGNRPLLAISLLSMHLFLFTPISLYLGNVSQVGFALSSALSIFLIYNCAFLLLLYIVYKVLPKSLQCVFVNIVLALTLLVWVQANVLVWDYGVLNGREIEWGALSWQPWLEVIVWCGLLFFFTWFSSEKVALYLFKFVVVVSVIKGLSVGVEVFEGYDNLPSFEIEPRDDKIASVGQFSKNRNVLHIVVDGFQSDIFNELVYGSSRRPEAEESFSGFKFYAETLGVFPYTRFSIPAFLSAEIYDNSEPKNTFTGRVLREKSILTLAKNNDFEVDIATPGGFVLNQYFSIRPDNLVMIDGAIVQKSKVEELSLWIDLSIFRSFPHFLKKPIHNQQQWLFSSLFERNPALGESFFLHALFLHEVISNIAAVRDANVYKYIHVHNTHNPMVTNPDCSYSGRAVGMDWHSLLIQSRCTLVIIEKLISQLKENGLYDEMLIIIHGDHGGWIDNGKPGQDMAALDRIVVRDGVHKLISGLASPLLLIKEPGAQGPLQISSQLVSLKQLPKSISGILGWDNNYREPSMRETENKQDYTREFYFYAYQRDAHLKEYLDYIQKYRFSGSHLSTAWEVEEVIRPPAGYLPSADVQ